MREFVRSASRILTVVALITPVAISTIPSQAITTTTMFPSNSDETKAANLLVSKWQGPFGGVPPFDQVQVALFKPALETAMAAQLAETERIAKNSAAPDFQNTIVALEEAGQELNRVSMLYGVWSSTMNGPEFQVVQREMAPRLAAFRDQITQNEALFKRIEAVYNSPAKSKLNSETAAVGVALLHKLRTSRCASLSRVKSSSLGDKSKARGPLHEVQSERSGRGDGPVHSS
ncbi:MAG TPA: hypothetical protein VFD63_26130 [Pyrinomonadaceae bacterium]|nr:hypothetical protein [Pyrinomonadaceae bacterium]